MSPPLAAVGNFGRRVFAWASISNAAMPWALAAWLTSPRSATARRMISSLVTPGSTAGSGPAAIWPRQYVRRGGFPPARRLLPPDRRVAGDDSPAAEAIQPVLGRLRGRQAGRRGVQRRLRRTGNGQAVRERVNRDRRGRGRVGGRGR